MGVACLLLLGLLIAYLLGLGWVACLLGLLLLLLIQRVKRAVRIELRQMGSELVLRLLLLSSVRVLLLRLIEIGIAAPAYRTRASWSSHELLPE